MPFENLRNDDERRKFILCSQSKIVGITVDYLLRNYQKVQAHGLKFDCLIVDDASLIHELDLSITLFA